MKSSKKFAAAALAAVALVGAACSSSSSSSTTSGGGASGSTIKLGLVASVTGAAASQYGTPVVQAVDAAIKTINAAGGANGHKLEVTVYDDQTSPTAITTQDQKAVSDGNVAIMSVSPVFFLAAKFPQQAGIPVIGNSDDGTEWGTQPYTNMFASNTGSVDPNYAPSALLGDLFKKNGGTTVCAWGYGISPSSTYGAANVIWSGLNAGLKKGVLDTSIPFGSLDFTTAALAGKTAGCDSIQPTMDLNSDVALTNALQQAGVKIKTMAFPVGLDPETVNSPAWSTLQAPGVYFMTPYRPVLVGNDGTKALQTAMQKYENRPTSQFPTYGIYAGWLAAELTIKGIELAGSTPTSAGIIKALRGVTDWNGNGILAGTTNYATNFGKAANPSCTWLLKAGKTAFEMVQKTTVCGALIAGKSGKVTP